VIEVIATVDERGVPQKLRTYASLIGPELKDFQKAKVYAVRDEGKTYEAAPVPGYQRTGTMSRQTVAYQRNEYEWVAEMRAPWSIFVRGSMTRGQAWMHVGRWTSWAEIVRRHLTGIKRELIDMLQRAKQKAGLS
jgi:hypothetical protein